MCMPGTCACMHLQPPGCPLPPGANHIPSPCAYNLVAAQFPDKADIGIFKGATGGWAGGEAALWQLREEIEEDLSVKSDAGPKEYPKPAPKPGAVPQYIGFGKS